MQSIAIRYICATGSNFVRESQEKPSTDLSDFAENLARDEKKLKSPAWHETVLEDRQEAFSSGKMNLTDWEKAKKRIKKNVSCG